MSRKDELAANLDVVHSQVRAAEAAAGRERGSVEILPVTKFHPVSDVELLGELGVKRVGENREQEARGKAEELANKQVDVRIAMIGQIQTKKANSVARWASEVHSLDSVKLAHALERGMALALERGDRDSSGGDVLPCLIQLSFDTAADAETRGGVSREDLPGLIAAVEDAQHLHLDGIMVVPPLESDPRRVFETSRSIADDLAGQLGRPMTLSAGMSADFIQAIEYGSDVVRVGTKLLGTRPVG